MTRKREIENLLSEVPEEASAQVLSFLRALVSQRSVKTPKPKSRRNGASVARRSFGMFPADAATVRQVLAEDLYGVE